VPQLREDDVRRTDVPVAAGPTPGSGT
jgi:hypothetical protein